MSSKHLTVSLAELSTQWSYRDAVDAHEVLDLIDLAESTPQPEEG